MLNKVDAATIANYIYKIDSYVRMDLSNSIIADERDYVSSFVSLCRFNLLLDRIRRLKIGCKWHAIVNNPSNERRFGCDGMIVFKYRNTIKVGMFEAKWPRYKTNYNYKWDSIQNATKTSHFSSQIERQSRWSHVAAIWEMFIYEGKLKTLSAPFDAMASTCVLHKDVSSFIKTHASIKTLWNNRDLDDLLIFAEKRMRKSNSLNLRYIIFEILTCQLGAMITVEDYEISFDLKPSNGESVSIPILREYDIEQRQRIEGFMSENGLSYFQQFDIDVDPQV